MFQTKLEEKIKKRILYTRIYFSENTAFVR